MASEKRPVTLGVLGAGDISPELVCDVLNEHFSFGPADPEGYFAPSDRYDVTLYLPASGAATSSGVHTVWEWAVRCELDYQVLWDETGNAHTADILGNTDTPEDITTVDAIGGSLIEHLSKGENPMLLLLSDEEVFDADTAEVAAAALRADIPCYDLARALLEVQWRHLPDQDPPQVPAPEIEDEAPAALAAVSDSGGVTLSAKDAEAISNALAHAEEFIDSVSGNVLARIGDVRQSLIHGRSLLAPAPPTVVEGEVPKKTRLEIFNPDTNQWEPAGRGRPPKGAQKRRVPA